MAKPPGSDSKDLSRRRFAGLSLGASAAYALGGAAFGPAARAASGPFDVVIIGAGPAGIGAGRRLLVNGKKPNFLILEGRSRIGGRTLTDTTTLPGVTWDLGAQWFHQVTPRIGANVTGAASLAGLRHFDARTAAAKAATRVEALTNNSLFNLAIAKGIPTYPDANAIITPDLNPRLLLDAAHKKHANLLNTPVLALELEMAGAIILAGLLAQTGGQPDISATEATKDFKNDPYYKLVAGLFEILFGGPLDTLSCSDVYVESATGISGPNFPSIDNWLISTGFGAFVASLAAHLPIQTGVKVKGVTWSAAGNITLDTTAGTVHTKKLIVTAPISVIPSLFRSDKLPLAYREAIGGLAMGTDAKVGLLLPPDFKLPVANNAFASPYIDSSDTSLAQLRAFGHPNFAIVIVSGKDVPQEERAGTLVAHGLDQLVAMLGSGVKTAFDRGGKGFASSWCTDPFSLGAYSYAKTGGVAGRKLLLQPINKRLYFAGEAISVGQHSSASGAFSSGQLAAQKVLRDLSLTG